MAARSLSFRFAAAATTSALWIAATGVEIAVGVIVVMAADTMFGVFGVQAVAATGPTDTFDFFLTGLPNSADFFFSIRCANDR